MFILIKAFASSKKPIETRVYVGPECFKIFAVVGGEERRCIGTVEFDPHFDYAISAAQKYALKKAEALLEQMTTDSLVSA